MPDYANQWAKLWNIIWENAGKAIDEVLFEVYKVGFEEGRLAPKEEKKEEIVEDEPITLVEKVEDKAATPQTTTCRPKRLREKGK